MLDNSLMDLICIDMDNTLIDSDKAHILSYNKAFVNNNLRKKLPKMSSDFLQKVQSAGIAGHIKTVRGMCHNLWKKIERLHQ